MKLAILATVLLFFIACTNTHRLVLMYESDEAVRGTLRIEEKDTLSTNVQEKENESQESFMDSFRNNLP